MVMVDFKLTAKLDPQGVEEPTVLQVEVRLQIITRNHNNSLDNNPLVSPWVTFLLNMITSQNKSSSSR